jgi:serine/threonine protein kinase
MRVCPKCGEHAVDDVIYCPKDGARLVGEEDTAEVRVRNADPLLGATVSGRYTIIRRIGEGGMGVVYEAEHIALGKHVALKVLREDFTRKADLIERFKQEARSASIIGHENIIDVSDFGTTELGGIFFAMELLKGEDLADLLQRETCVPLPRAVHILGQMCRALHAAHQKGIIHRDLKPENIFLVQRDDRRDVVKVLDFGIAKMTTVDAEGRRLTQSGVIFGTPEYMAPEQARGQTLDHRVDIYAAGVMLYEMLCGQVPFTGESFVAILTQHLFSEAKPLAAVNPKVTVPKAIESIIFKAMSKDRDERYSTMLEMLEDLQRAMAGDSVEARSSTLPITGQRPILQPREPRSDSFTQPPAAVDARTRSTRRRGPWVVLLVLLLLGGGVAGAYFLWQQGYFGGDTGSAVAPSPGDAPTIVRAALDTTAAAPDTEAKAEAGGDTDVATGVAADAAAAPAEGAASPDGAATSEAQAEAAEPDGGDGGEPADAVPGDGGAQSATDGGAAGAKITLEVRTVPPGAQLFDGRSRLLCASTPCRVETEVGAVLMLHAEKDPNWTGDDRVAVRAGTRRMTMTLRRPVAPLRDAGAVSPPPDASPFHLRQPDATTPH